MTGSVVVILAAGQSNLRAIGQLGVVRRAPVGFIARVELVGHLLTPLWQTGQRQVDGA